MTSQYPQDDSPACDAEQCRGSRPIPAAWEGGGPEEQVCSDSSHALGMHTCSLTAVSVCQGCGYVSMEGYGRQGVAAIAG
jgi:hypothetical protein